jgi:hypothetical protein
MYMPSQLDVAILEALRDLGFARSYQVALWTGAAGSTTAKRISRLHSAGLVERHEPNAELRGARGVTMTGTVIWVATSAGLRHLAPVRVWGTGAEVTLGKARPSATRVTATLATNDVLLWYRSYACWHIVTERQMHSAESHTPQRPSAGRYWTVTATQRQFDRQRLDLARLAGKATHAPDGGLVLRGPGGSTRAEVALEVEVSAKPSADLAVAVASLRDAGRRQVWHITRPGVLTRMVDDVLGGLLGVIGTWERQDLWVAEDRSVFVQRAKLGPAAIGNIATADLTGVVPSWAPLGIPAERITGPRWEGARDLSHVTAAAAATRELRKAAQARAAAGLASEAPDSGWWGLDAA